MILSVVMLGAAGVALVLSVVLALRGVRERKAADSFTERAVVTTADVLETRPKDVAMSGEPVTIYFHLVRYDVDGEPVTAETMSGMEPPIPHVGERVEVRYDSAHPRRVWPPGWPAGGARTTHGASGRTAAGPARPARRRR